MMERYSEYKDSGVKWLGKIPSHWEVMPLKSFIKFEKGKTPKEFSDENNGLPYLTMDYLRSRDNKIVKYPISSVGLFKIEEFEALVLWDGANAGEFILSKKGYLGSTMAKISGYRKYYNNLYFYYFLKMLEPTSKNFANGTTIPHFDASILINYHYPIPPIDEQKAIGSYLDTATSEIDKAIAMQQKMIDLLNERKQIIIQNAVTKGLDENVEMKESGVEWIGRIPKHWSKDKTMRMFGLYGSGTTPRENIEGGNIPWINSGDLNNSSLKVAAKYVSEKTVKEISALKVYPENSIIIAMYGASIGKISISKIECCTNQACFVLSYPYEKIRLEYAFYSLMTCKKKWIEQSQGGTQPNINADIIKQTWLALPPLKEQEEIVDFIEEKCNAIEKTIETISRQITLLQERKQIIINEVVTGKVRVS